MSSLFRRGTKKKNKKAKEPPILPSARNTADGSKTAHKTATRENDEDDVKEVLQLFNRLEELVVDGDPRVKEALNQKPSLFLSKQIVFLFNNNNYFINIFSVAK